MDVFTLALFVLSLMLGPADGWNSHESVLLQEVQVLTLYKNRFTTARRTSPVPQLQCNGGTAGCSAFVSEVVQCQNKGWDGFDVQWECKTDMDNNYRFGTIQVNCEGYNSPDDPYVLKGSCGLEYTLELTEAGRMKRNKGYGSGGFSSNFFKDFSNNVNSPVSSDSSGVLVVVILLVIAYGIYKIFLSSPQSEQPFPGSTGDFNTDRQNYYSSSHSMGPSPPGFKPDFAGHSTDGEGFSGGFNFGNYDTRHRHNGNSGPGFWTGLGTGGILGYMFGNQRSNQSPYTNIWGNPAYPPPMHGYPSANRGVSESTGTRTASGFGGTKRR
ncbi:store-operated calcium entry-associated regulatory factor [Latimeria chalumnae]|uniref:Store-operated calcium entry-associated regulatory factor n=1 Tax=Latimeria chalumnae TaxID=7897 RepID=H3A655_LATCH|nr:PREDICTED: store-operated calcium entry-associated regulatory factor [Latimeria chalumnae]|eukprot:XP_006010005.1 PREDICTED: store-operated calcium entry-associated regulatory factor [Latimeria chalumnae]